MNENEIGEIEDIIGMLGDVEEHDGQYAEECAERLFQLINIFSQSWIIKLKFSMIN